MPDGKILQIGFLIFPEFPMSCLTSMIEPLRAANEICGAAEFEWKLISETGGKVSSSAGIAFQTHVSLAEADDVDILIVLSSPSSRFHDPVASEGKLRKLARHGMTMGAVSGGVFPLARAGVLENHLVSVHWCYEAAFASEFPHHNTSENLMVVDRNRLTAAGATSAFDLSLHLIEERIGAEVANEAACWFQHPQVRSAEVYQIRPTVASESTNDMLPPIVRRAVEIFAQNISDPVPIAAVSSEIGISARQLERAFKKATGTSPLSYYRSTRMRLARQLVIYRNDSLEDIAHAVGYNSSSTLTKNYLDEFGIHPSVERKNACQKRLENNALPTDFG